MASPRALRRCALHTTGFALGVGVLGVPQAFAQPSPSAPTTASTPTASTPPIVRLDRILHPPDPKAQTPMFYGADYVESVGERTIEAWGAVELRDRTHRFNASWARYNSETDQLSARGNVVLRQLGDTVRGTEIEFNRTASTGVVRNAAYELGPSQTRPLQFHAQGRASELILPGPDRYEAKDATYTTCDSNGEWLLGMKELDIDQTRMVGTARNVVLYFKSVPILYTPWLDFPLDRGRKSGLLAPSFGSTGRRGLEVTVPYYLNLAPNYDATLSPRLMSKRGLELNTQGRYLFNGIKGEIDASYLPRDNQTGNDRYGFAWKHEQSLGWLLPGLGASVNINKVSDDFYFTDLSDHISATSQTNLPREFGLTYNLPNVGFAARIQHFQTLQDPLAPIVSPYHRVPQVSFGTWKNEVGGVADIALPGEFARFTHSTLVEGDRTMLNPTVSAPHLSPGFFFTPKVGLHYAGYNLDRVGVGQPAKQDVSIPWFSLDSGQVYERPARFAGREFTQTLEPRVYYVHVPYRNQSNVPLFDTALADFNYSQIFSENRFVGGDRIGDANQVTTAITSRLVESSTGIERLKVAVGQIYYFEPQRVTLDKPATNDHASDILALVAGQVTPAFTMELGVQYNPNRGRDERIIANLRYSPAPGSIVNAAYRFTRNEVNPLLQIRQIDVSAQWPIGRGWNLVGRINWSLQDRKVLEGLAGFEYNAGCWEVRAVAHRFTTATQQTSTSFQIQLELTGLSRIGINPLETLRQNIAGYKRSDEIPQ